jgi:hypothetical protein
MFMIDMHGSARVGQEHRPPADLLGLARIDVCAKGPRHQLGAETNTERRPSGCKAALKQRELIHDERIRLLLVCADGPAEHDHEFRVKSIDSLQFIEAGIAELYGVARLPDRLGEGAEILKMNMADRHSRSQRHLDCSIAL